MHVKSDALFITHPSSVEEVFEVEFAKRAWRYDIFATLRTLQYTTQRFSYLGG